LDPAAGGDLLVERLADRVVREGVEPGPRARDDEPRPGREVQRDEEGLGADAERKLEDRDLELLPDDAGELEDLGGGGGQAGETRAQQVAGDARDRDVVGRQLLGADGAASGPE